MANGVAGRKAFKMPESPIILKELILQCGINQAAISELADISRPLLNLTLNRGYIPPKAKDFQKKVENYISKNRKAMHWLIERGLQARDVWRATDMRIKKHAMPAGFGASIAGGQRKHAFIQ